MIEMIRHWYRVAQSKSRENDKLKTRSPKWRAVRDHHLIAEPQCRACNSKKTLQVHHIQPFSMHPELELDHNNLMTLCMDTTECHLRLGHGGNFQTDNLSVVADVEEVRNHPENRVLVEDRAKAARVRETDKSS